MWPEADKRTPNIERRFPPDTPAARAAPKSPIRFQYEANRNGSGGRNVVKRLFR